jgi:membrane peptidoglycan carboxypeptidase
VNLDRAGVSDSWKIFALKDLSSVSAIHRRRAWAVTVLAVLVFTPFAVLELRSSWIESRLFSMIDRRVTFSLKAGPSSDLQRPSPGPYDQRLGFSNLADLVARLRKNGYEVTGQARVSETALALTLLGLSPIYHEKSQAGLRIDDRAGIPFFEAGYPVRIYPEFRAIPPLVVNTLLFIENRQLQDRSSPERNPAVEWERLTKAVLDLAIHTVDRKHPMIGGSTLATQLEKMRHSPGGRTNSVSEKIRQVASASLRAYLDGIDTRGAQQRIICDYINSIPLAATPAQGEVIGLGDGLQAWYGADFDSVNHLLSANEDTLDSADMEERARAYREVLSLIVALRAPTWYLSHHPDVLALQTDRYLRLLAAKGVISTRVRDLALRSRQEPRPQPLPERTGNFVPYKAPNLIRSTLLPQLGLQSGYSLDRLDLTVQTTLDKDAQDSATRFLESLSDPSVVDAAGLHQYQLLDRGNPQSVIYSVTLFERTKGANELRIQTDNYDHPLDINQGTKLQLGSTAKLRTLIHYMEIITELHEKYARMSPDELRSVAVIPGDNLTAWALSYLSTATDKGLQPMLETALKRKYSGNPGEAFFTAGGLHHFANFERSEDSEIMTVSEGFQRSVNLVFIRLLRDIERYYMYRVPGASPTVLSDPANQARHRYLVRFADLEGRQFLKRFYEKYRGQTFEQALNTLVSGVNLTPLRAAVIYRSVRPQDGQIKFDAFLQAHVPASAMARQQLDDLYTRYGPDKFNLQDRGYLARIHPLELWLLNYREQHPEATLAQVYTDSANQRQEVYQWLFTTRYKHAQDKRIETLLEMDAFKEIHRAWKRLGYPFDSLVPSYATAIGVSGDTPAALAKLVGILLNDGVSYPTVRIQQLHFGQDTPSETILRRRPEPGEQLLPQVVARIVRREMLGVVEKGTGRRARGGLKLPDGTVLPIGGKTGTGDNQFHIYGKGGGLLDSRAVNRTAAFAFFIGDRFFGTIVAFVPGNNAASYKFTSALAVQVLKDLTPTFIPLIEKTYPEHFSIVGQRVGSMVIGGKHRG